MAKAKTITRYRARPKKKTRRKAKFTLPILAVAPLAPPIVDFATQTIKEGPQMAANNMVAAFTGYNSYQRNFDMGRLKKTYTPILLGLVAHKVANWSGINRMLGRAKIPVIRL